MSRIVSFVIALMVALAPAGCERRSEPPTAEETAAAAPAPTNRVDVNATVRQNLGITFARVERRPVDRTLRAPGRFELVPNAKREYRAPAPGIVELLVRQYQRVEAGAPLYRLDSPRWRELQRELTDANAAVRLAQAGADSIEPFKEAHEKHHLELQSAVDVWSRRVAALEELQAAGGARGEEVAQARATLATSRADLAETLEKEAELTARESAALAELDAARSRMTILLATAASLHSTTPEVLAARDGEAPRWQTIGQVEVVALSPGVVDSALVNTGSLVDAGAPALTTVQPELVRFRAHALQSAIGRLADGMPATVVAPLGGSLGVGESIAGTLSLAPTADAERRTIEVIMTPQSVGALPPWAKAGVTAFLEVVVGGTREAELAIPLACVAQDGAQRIIFRRDPADADKVIRMGADLGVDDGRWVVIRSGVGEGNEIVLDGVYQLMVATSGSITRGGHFHPDGTFHEGDK